MKALIKYWQSKLRWHQWFMSDTDREMIRETIRVLKILDKATNKTRAEIEADLVLIGKGKK